MDAAELHRRTTELWMDRVAAIGADQWGLPTPCSDWDVRALVNHVVGEDRWTVPLMAGATIEEVGSELDGDLLGHDAGHAASTAAAAAITSVAEQLPALDTVHLSYGAESPEEYVRQLSADHLIHGWDLAVASGGDAVLDPELVTEVADWFAEREDGYRSAGVIADRATPTGDPQADLLAGFGRDAAWSR